MEWHELDECNTKINTGYATLSRGIPWNIPRYRESLELSGVLTSLEASVYTKKIQVISEISRGYATRKVYMTILYRAMDNTVAR